MTTTASQESNRRAWRSGEFARAHGIGLTTFWTEIREGRLIAHKVGKLTLIYEEDAKAWRDSLPTAKTMEVA